MVSGSPLEMPQKKHNVGHFLYLSLWDSIQLVVYWQLVLYHFKAIHDAKPIAPPWFPLAHDHPSQVPLHWSTWEEEVSSQLQIEAARFGSKCCKASDPNNNIQMGSNWLEAYSVRDHFKSHHITLNHRVMNSTGNAPETLILSDTTFTKDSLALNHGVRNSTAFNCKCSK